MKIYRLYQVSGLCGDPYYQIENESTIGYFATKEKAEHHPTYQEYMQKKQYYTFLIDEEDEPYYIAIEEIDVIE